MPSNLIKTKKDEELWERAKAQAAKSGHEEDWPYIVSIFKKMKGENKESKDKGPKKRLTKDKRELLKKYIKANIH